MKRTPKVTVVGLREISNPNINILKTEKSEFLYPHTNTKNPCFPVLLRSISFKLYVIFYIRNPLGTKIYYFDYQEKESTRITAK